MNVKISVRNHRRVLSAIVVLNILCYPIISHAGDVMDSGVDKCVNAYYGIGEKTDYAKAYKCFSTKQVWPYLIIMQLNGEGVPANPDKAKEFMDDWLKADPINAQTTDVTQMEQIVERRLHAKKPSSKKINFCADVAGTTYSMDFCGDLNNKIQQQTDNIAMTVIRAKLNPGQVVLWDKIQVAADTYEKAEGERLLQQYVNGTIRGIAYESQISFVRHNFIELMKNVFNKRELKPATTAKLEKLNMDMMAAYKRDVDKYIEANSFMNDPGSTDDLKQQYQSDISTYKADAKESQKAWEVLCNLSATLAASVYSNKSTDWTASMQVAMTKIRIIEIKNDPVGSDGG